MSVEREVWRCFHCSMVFVNRDRAREHFGDRETKSPACTIDVAEYRRMEEANRRFCQEDSNLYLEISRIRSEHNVALVREEEKGYAKGLQDGRQIDWPKARHVERVGDMGPEVLRVTLDWDNDVSLSVNLTDTVEFCNAGGNGGGRSPHTRAALINLMAAIERDAAGLRPVQEGGAKP